MPFYVHISNRHNGNYPGEWHRWLLTAATRDDAKRFYWGLHKYTKTDNASIKSVTAETMEWWNYDASDGFSLQNLYKWIQQKQTDQYKDIQELTDTRERTLLTILPDTNFGDRFWLILPGFQDTSIEDLWEDRARL
ncbi:hypothetical protein BP00DRAFT_421424 [Aspergillus indologenus CBS 114.80]|uniref:Uncharacterized protein n=1 Tax=Aspergillus indologenus CBS 114.80 TaxID=1450541 RepID=A0A2V5IIG9_9EURO|nr:hypothetical protein BP00DRAFT_421424 [Aspergillus indologenus CBS 114.80]